ncbi:hypothetical protein ACW14X_00455 [Nocardioides sp. YJ-D4]
MSNALRLTVLGLVGPLVLLGPLVGYSLWQSHRLDESLTSVSATVVATTESEVTVEWVDLYGKTHVDDLPAYVPSIYTDGAAIEISYDENHPDWQPVFSDPYESSYQDGFDLIGAFALAVVGIVLVVWLFRWGAVLVSRSRASTLASVSVWSDRRGRPWLKLHDRSQPTDVAAWQLVTWERDMEEVSDASTLEVRGSLHGRRRVTVVGPSGRCWTPLGSLRHQPPGSGIRRWGAVSDYRDEPRMGWLVHAMAQTGLFSAVAGGLIGPVFGIHSGLTAAAASGALFLCFRMILAPGPTRWRIQRSAHVLRLTALAMIGTTMVTGAAFGYGLWQRSSLAHESAAAEEIATGVVIEDGIGDSGDVRVRWQSPEGTFVQRFKIYADETYVVGTPFDVRYASDGEPGIGYPADPSETAASDDYFALQLAAFAVLMGYGIAWSRWWSNVLATLRNQPSRARASASRDEFGRPWLWLMDTSPRRAAVAQRVSWEPGIENLDEPRAVHVLGQIDTDKRVAVVLPDGQILFPRGRSHGEDRLGTPWEPNRSMATDLPPYWWRRLLLAVTVSAVVGASTTLWLGIHSREFAAVMAGLAVVIVLNTWAMGGKRATEGLPLRFP